MLQILPLLQVHLLILLFPLTLVIQFYRALLGLLLGPIFLDFLLNRVNLCFLLFLEVLAFQLVQRILGFLGDPEVLVHPSFL